MHFNAFIPVPFFETAVFKTTTAVILTPFSLYLGSQHTVRVWQNRVWLYIVYSESKSMHKDTLPFSPREEKAAILYILSTTDTQREVRVLIEYFNLKL